MVKSEDIIEVQRSDLVSNYIGDTAKKTETLIKKSFGKVIFIDEAYTLVSSSEKDYGREAVEAIMRYMLPGPDNTQYPVFVFAGYKNMMAKFVSINKGLKQRIKHTFDFVDYSPLQLSKIVEKKLHGKKIRFPFGIRDVLANCFAKIDVKKRSDLNASLCDDLINEVRTKQEVRLDFSASFNELMMYNKEDFEQGIESLLSRMKDEYNRVRDKSTQTSWEVELHIPNVGLVPCSPLL